MLTALLLLLILTVVYLIHPLIVLVVRQLTTPLRAIHGPPSPSLFLGNLRALDDQENSNITQDWIDAYGSTFVYRGFLGGKRLFTVDPVAITYILTHAYDFPKPPFVREALAAMAAGHHGLLTVEGEDHKRQRKILAPAFSAMHIKSLSPIFFQKAIQLRDIWMSIYSEQASSPSPAAQATPPHVRVDVLIWLSRATLDVIGLAGFGYNFHSLSTAATSRPIGGNKAATAPPAGAVDNPDELAQAFSVIFSTARKLRVITILQAWIPILRIFRRNNKTMNQAKATMRRIGLGLIAERQRELSTDPVKGFDCLDVNLQDTKDSIEGAKTTLGRDLLSVLIRSNHATNPREQLSHEETLCQISTFIAAGHETIASALTWCLYALARTPAAQTRLRAELRALPPPSSSSSACAEDALQRCTYLDWVVRETLRVHTPVTSTMRTVGRARDAIPLSDGASPVQVRRGDIISIPIAAINRSVDIWGPDAGLFRPERWAEVPVNARAVPGLWANMMTFLGGGGYAGGAGRSCIGWKFALAEIKILLFVLVRDLEFTIDSDLVVEKRINVVTRPFIKSEPELGNQLPLLVRPVPLEAPSPPPPPPPPSSPPLHSLRDPQRACASHIHSCRAVDVTA